MNGLIGYAAYLPYWRLDRASVRAAHGGSGGGQGYRCVASYDEDSTSMAVEAARTVLRSAPAAYRPSSLWFATTAPSYLDKSNAVVIHAALSLPDATPAYDLAGGVGSGLGAADAARQSGGVATLSDVRTGLPGSADESTCGDAAVALAFGDGPDVIAEPVAQAASVGEFLDRWREPGRSYSKVWEERFGEHAYAPHVERAVNAALKSAGMQAHDLDHVIVTGLHERAARQAVRTVGASREAVADNLLSEVGNTGTAHWALLLADFLDRAQPGQTVAVVTLADGAQAQIWRTNDALARYHRVSTVRGLIGQGQADLDYLRFLSWRGMLEREPPRRPEPDRPAAPPSLRSAAWKFAFTGSQDEAGNRHLPPARVSYQTHSLDRMTAVPMADVQGTIVTFTIDRLAYSPSPPLVVAVIDFDGGGRYPCELTDVDPDAIRIGDRVGMTFRRLYSRDGVHNYFWKARPRPDAETAKAG
jgi:hydroxymethylglutaryl-CoA synthase